MEQVRRVRAMGREEVVEEGSRASSWAERGVLAAGQDVSASGWDFAVGAMSIVVITEIESDSPYSDLLVGEEEREASNALLWEEVCIFKTIRYTLSRP